MPWKVGGDRALWSCIMPGLPTHLVQELNVSTVYTNKYIYIYIYIYLYIYIYIYIYAFVCSMKVYNFGMPTYKRPVRTLLQYDGEKVSLNKI